MRTQKRVDDVEAINPNPTTTTHFFLIEIVVLPPHSEIKVVPLWSLPSKCLYYGRKGKNEEWGNPQYACIKHMVSHSRRKMKQKERNDKKKCKVTKKFLMNYNIPHLIIMIFCFDWLNCTCISNHHEFISNQPKRFCWMVLCRWFTKNLPKKSFVL